MDAVPGPPFVVTRISTSTESRKIVCSTWLHRLKPAVTRHAVCVQRGFIPQRNFVQNVVDLDTDGRRAAMQKNEAMMKAKGPILPAIVTWDFAAAVPSVSHQFLWMVLSCMRIIRGLQNVLAGICLEC